MEEARAIPLEIPAGALVVLVGPSGAGKSTFAARHFKPTEVLSSDRFRAMIADDEADQSVSAMAFELVGTVARWRLGLGRATVVDATSTTAEARGALLAIARETGAPAAAIVLDVPLAEALRHNEARRARRVEPSVVASQVDALTHSLPEIGNEGFDRVYILRGTDEVSRAVVVRL